jgi:hypothetical protein
MLVVRGLEEDAALEALVQALDGAVARNPALHLNVFVVFLSDELTNVVTDDDTRDRLAGRLEEKLAETLKLRHVVLSLDDKADLARYDLDASKTLTVVLYRNLEILASHALKRDEIKGKTKAILDQVADKLGAR